MMWLAKINDDWSPLTSRFLPLSMLPSPFASPSALYPQDKPRVRETVSLPVGLAALKHPAGSPKHWSWFHFL